MATDIDFPADLPCGQREGYSLELVQPFARTQMAGGRAKQRQTFDNVPELATVSWIFTPQEAMFFEAWFRYKIRNGTDWFNVDLRTPLDGRSNPGVSSYECRFTEVYSKAMEGAHDWRFTGSLELLERQTLAESWLEFPEFVLQAEIIDLAANVEWPS
ncbi:hypothetical protein ACMG4M_05350 [Alcanivorax sp. IL3]|uniref:hypothetical protein n=1 Tax=unclassified Alcanivorax TaxID=2638842 RepID=UPI0039C228B0